MAFSKKLQRYTEVLRIWNVVADHDEQEDAIRNIQDSHRKGLTCNEAGLYSSSMQLIHSLKTLKPMK